MKPEIRKDILKLYKWLAITNGTEKSDIIFLLGGSVIDIAKKGLQLFNEGYAPLIITTGCTGTFGNPEWKEPIADIFAEYLRKHGVAKKQILIQNRSMNTPEDVLYSLPILEESNIKLKSIILVSRPVHQRRAYATFRKQFPYKLKIINQPCQEVSSNSLSGKTLIGVGIRCIEEYKRLIKYAKKGDIEKQEIPIEIHSAFNRLNKFLLQKQSK